MVDRAMANIAAGLVSDADVASFDDVVEKWA